MPITKTSQEYRPSPPSSSVSSKIDGLFYTTAPTSNSTFQSKNGSSISTGVHIDLKKSNNLSDHNGDLQKPRVSSVRLDSSGISDSSSQTGSCSSRTYLSTQSDVKSSCYPLSGCNFISSNGVAGRSSLDVTSASQSECSFSMPSVSSNSYNHRTDSNHSTNVLDSSNSTQSHAAEKISLPFQNSSGPHSPRTLDLDIGKMNSSATITSSNASTLHSVSTLSSDEPTSPNPTLWIGEDQMLLLTGATASEVVEDSNSCASDTRSFEGLLSPNGTSILWDEDTDWILLFDNMIRYADRKQNRTSRSCGCRGHRNEDEVDSRSQLSTKAAAKRASSAPPVRRGIFAGSKQLPSSSSGAGGADEEMFIKSFEDVTRITLHSAKELETELSKIKETLDPSNDWEKRIDAIKKIRSVLIANGADYDEFFQYLRQLEHPFQTCVKDLRSQVVREACITIAYLSQQLGNRLDHFSEALLPSLINLIQNSAKIMSTAGIVAIHFIIRYTHVSRLVPIIVSHLSSKSKDIRKSCFEFLDQLLITWPTHTLEKHVALLQDAIKKGISDADPEARAFSRKAYWSFADHFPEQAHSLLNSLDNSKQRMLQDELTMSNSSSSSSLTQNTKNFRPPTYSHGGSVENLRCGTLGRRSGIPHLSNSKPEHASGIPKQLRSTSAIDLGAVRRAKARATYTTFSSLSRGSGASLPRTTVRRADSAVNAITSPDRVIKGRNKGTQSQPGSRPDSPSSRLSYATYSTTDGSASGRVRRKSGIPTATSRETSPTRAGYAAHERRLSGSRTRLVGAGERYPPVSSTTTTPLMAERTLQQSREAEVAVADALRAPVRRRYNAFDDQSDESETSSVCSDRSFSSFGRSVDDISEVIHNLNSIHWTDRKEGLQALQAFFRSSRMLSSIELRKVTDIFAKIFMDPHTKVFTLFLDTLNELILIHKQDLHNWLYVLLTRLFLKMGADILGSVLAKILKTLELVKESFPYENQFQAIMRFLNDQTQTPNTKVKIALLKYLNSLINEMDPSKFSSANNETRFALMKVISWTSMPKTSELRKHGEDVLLSLFYLNPSEYSNLLDQLPKTYKDSAFQLLHSRYPRAGSESSPSTGIKNSQCPVMSHIQSPNSGHSWSRSHGSTPQNRSFEYDDTENLNPDEFCNLLKKTLSEIEEYKPEYYEKDNEKIISQSPSRDSGISPNMAVDGRLDNLVDRLDHLDLGSSTDSSPTKRSPTDYSTHFSPNNSLFEREICTSSDGGNMDDHAVIVSIVDDLNQNSRYEKKVQALGKLIHHTRSQPSIVSSEDFKALLGVVIQAVEDPNVSVRSRALKALCELIKYKADYFQEYVELTLLKILEAHKDTESDIMPVAESCSAIAAAHLPLEQCVRTLKPLILTGQLPINQAAIKMLSKLVEHHPKATVLQLLPEIMPALIKAYDNNESAVRKAAVFCMVAIHSAVGEAMKPHLSTLNGSKLKLLNVYIKKSQLQNNSGSTPGSPGNPPSSSSSQ